MTIYLVRHGETAWSKTGQHTGRTDVPLTPRGRIQASMLQGTLGHLRPDRVLTSPLSRARETCDLAGLGAAAEIDERLIEWDYGDAEGRTTAEIRLEQPGWSVWTHGIANGEQLDDVGRRCDLVVSELRDPDATFVLFGHAHLLRILVARWCLQPPLFGSHLVVDPASVGVLGYERTTPVIQRWNVLHDREL